MRGTDHSSALTTEQPRLTMLTRTGVVCLTDFAVSGRKQRFSYHEIIRVREVHAASRRWRHTLGRAQQSWLESLLTELEAVSTFHNIYGYFSDLHLWQHFVQHFFQLFYFRMICQTWWNSVGSKATRITMMMATRPRTAEYASTLISRPHFESDNDKMFLSLTEVKISPLT